MTLVSSSYHENHPLSSVPEDSTIKCISNVKQSIEMPNFSLRLSDAELDIARKLSFSAALDDSKGRRNCEDDTASSVPSNEKVQIVIRVRPFETDEESMECFRVLSNTTMIAHPPKTALAYRSTGGATTSFQFSHIFQPSTAQENLFEATTKPVLEAAFRGHHGLVFAYGVTNSGKTYTITGTPAHPGVLPRALTFALEEMHRRKENDEHPITSIMASYIEIYNDKVYDLLTNVASHKRRALRLQECDGRIQVRGMVEKPLMSVADAEMLLSLGQKNKQVADTRCNHDSSRSHCIFTLSLYHSGHELGSKVSIVDLAGCERSAKTGARGLRMMETSKINSSLMHLMRCLEILRWNQSHPISAHKMVPYRESKLTRLFQEHLNGRQHGPVVMIVAVNPSPHEFEETLRTLRYSAIAKELVTTDGVEGDKRRGSGVVGYDLDGRRMKRRRQSNRILETECVEISEAIVEDTFGRYMMKGGIVKPVLGVPKVPLRSIRSHSAGEAIAAERQREVERELHELRGRVTVLEHLNHELETSKLVLEEEKKQLSVQLSQANANQLGWELQLRAEIGQEMQRQLQEFKTKFRIQQEAMIVLQQKLEKEEQKFENEQIGREQDRNRLERLVQQLQEKLNESEDEIKRIEARQQMPNHREDHVALSPTENIISDDTLQADSRGLRRSTRISIINK